MRSTPHRWSINEDRTLLRIGFPDEGPVQQYDAYQLDELIAGLVEMRAAMNPEVPMSDPDPGTRMLVATRGRFYVQSRPQDDAVALLLLHPGLRWVGMMFGRSGVLDLIDKLRQHLPDQPDMPNQGEDTGLGGV